MKYLNVYSQDIISMGFSTFSNKSLIDWVYMRLHILMYCEVIELEQLLSFL